MIRQQEALDTINEAVKTSEQLNNILMDLCNDEGALDRYKLRVAIEERLLADYTGMMDEMKEKLIAFKVQSDQEKAELRRNYESKMDELARRNAELIKENEELRKQVQEGVVVMARALQNMDEAEECQGQDVTLYSHNHSVMQRPRTTKFHDIGVRGRKTGWKPKDNVRKDDDGYDNIEDFWNSPAVSERHSRQRTPIHSPARGRDYEEEELYYEPVVVNEPVVYQYVRTPQQQIQDENIVYSASRGGSVHPVRKSIAYDSPSHRVYERPAPPLSSRRQTVEYFEEEEYPPSARMIRKPVYVDEFAEPEYIDPRRSVEYIERPVYHSAQRRSLAPRNEPGSARSNGHKYADESDSEEDQETRRTVSKSAKGTPLGKYSSRPKISSESPKRTLSMAKKSMTPASRKSIRPQEFEEDVGVVDEPVYDDYMPEEQRFGDDEYGQKSIAEDEQLSEEILPPTKEVVEDSEPEEASVVEEKPKKKRGRPPKKDKMKASKSDESSDEKRIVKASVSRNILDELEREIEDKSVEIAPPSKIEELDTDRSETKEKKQRGRPRKRVLESDNDGSDAENHAGNITTVVEYVNNKVIERDENDRPVRNRMAPLKYWANEKSSIVLVKDEEFGIRVPVMRSIIKKPFAATPVKPARKGRKPGVKREPTERALIKRQRIEDDPHNVAQPSIPVVNRETGEEEEKNLVISPVMIDFKEAPNHGFKFRKTYSEGQFIASGFLLLPPGSEKPNKNSKDASMVFIVLEGSCEVYIHQSRFKVGAGTQFCVPRGNQYKLKNEGEEDCRIFFVHGKETSAETKESSSKE